MRRRLGNSFPVCSIVAFFEDFSFRILTMVLSIIATCNDTDSMKEAEKLPAADHEIELDEETDALFEAIGDAGDDASVGKLVEIADIDPDAFAAFMKATGKQDDPTAKALLQAARDRRNEPKP